MKPSQNALDLIEKFEGCQLIAYKCPTGVWTIGYGHTQDVTKGMNITQQEAEEYLVDDAEMVAEQLNEVLSVKMTQNQFDALVSLVYNIGIGQFSQSKLLQYINESNFSAASHEFDWIKSNGEVLQGLVKRRAAEEKLFNQLD